MRPLSPRPAPDQDPDPDYKAYARLFLSIGIMALGFSALSFVLGDFSSAVTGSLVGAPAVAFSMYCDVKAKEEK